MRVIAVAAVVLLAGCAGAVEGLDDAEGSALAATAHPVGQEPEDMQPGSLFVVDHDTEVSFAGTCDGTCVLRVEPAATGPDAWLDVRVHWDGASSTGFEAWVEDDAGKIKADVRRGFDTARAVVWSPSAQAHTIVVAGEGELTGSVRLRAVEVPAVPGDDLLPNLVTLTPIGLRVGECKIEESAEEGAVRCLRLGNSVGNVGDGPLEVHLDFANGALSAAGAGRFVQRVYQPDGHRDVQASGAEFHPTHGHFHYAGLAHFELYPLHDALRGDMVAVGHKRGFCFLDWGPMDVPEAPPDREQHAEQNCLLPDITSGWSMGISRGWYDYYWAELADQYIDIEGVPDGTYELVSVADGAGTLLETDETDNKASVVIELQGDRVRVLEERALYDNPEQA